jgi:hypothetical protein
MKNIWAKAKIEYEKKMPSFQHYHPNLEWAGRVWIKAGVRTVGYDRSKGYAKTYEPELAAKLSNVDTCPE